MTSAAAESPPRTLLVVGHGEVSAALDSIATTLGWKPVIVETLDDAKDAITALSAFDAVVVTSHHDGTDGPALAAAVASDVGYVGAMGSRKTQARRREWMLDHGVPQDLVDSVRGPAGLDIGSNTPAEIAVSMVAEIIAVHRGVTGGSLSDRTGQIHPDLVPGTAECPAG